MTRVFCNGKLFLREKNAPPSFFMCAFFLSLFFASKRLYVFRVLEVFFWCARALSRQTKKKLSLSRRFYNTHFRSLFLFAFKTTFYARSCSLAAQRESLLPKKKRGTPKTPAKLCCFDSFFGEGARAFRKRKRERERRRAFFATRERSRYI